MELTWLLAQMTAQWESAPDPYTRLNRLRDWLNATLANYELYLEDEWNKREPGFTDIEYIFRSLDTRNETDWLAYDRYHNNQDAKGVWHLGDYVETVLRIEDLQGLIAFIQANTPPRIKPRTA